MTKLRISIFAAFAVVLLSLFIGIIFSDAAEANDDPDFRVKINGKDNVLFEKNFGDFYHTENTISDNHIMRSASSDAVAILWNEKDRSGKEIHKYALSMDGKNIGRIHETDYHLKLRYASFDPLKNFPRIPQDLANADNGSRGENTYIVQFVTQPLEDYRRSIVELGGKVHTYLPDFAHIVQMNDKTRQSVESLPFVRWVGKYEPVYKLEEDLIDGLLLGRLPESAARYNVMVLERGERMQNDVAESITAWSGKVVRTSPEGFLMEAELSPEQLLQLAQHKDIQFIDKWSPPETDMNIVRSTGGADFIENTLGFTGQGVRAEVMDSELRTTHQEFQARPPLFHHSGTPSSFHGTGVYGIVFAQGVNPEARGMIPDAQGIFSHYDGYGSRHAHTARLLQAPYNAVFQTNSWGNGRTRLYANLSAEMDDILFQNDIVILQSQSNAGNQDSRPQAWAKNIVSVGGIIHYNTADFTDDRWANGASTGPAADGRIKPDLAHFYDATRSPHNLNDIQYTNFSGTSGATPITAGHFGLFYQMWQHGIFGNPTSQTVFESRPKAATVKAIMINTAVQWNMAQFGTDINRARQGWGRANVENLYNLREKMLIINETDPVVNLQTRTYRVNVPNGSTDPLKVTMVYTDPQGSPTASISRINDLSLRVTAPNGTTRYWGNVGLGGSSMWSSTGGNANTVDTVENVFISSPASGIWTIEVIASEINQDARMETPGVVDADYALVVSGIQPLLPTSAPVNISGRIVTNTGRGINNAEITITAADGSVGRARSNQFGYYTLNGVASGRDQVITVTAKGRVFEPASRILQIDSELTDIDFTALR